MKYLVVIVDSLLVASSFSSVKVVEIKRISKTKSKQKGVRKRGRKGREREPWPTGLLQRCSLLAMYLHCSAIHVGNTLVSVRRGAGPTTAGKISLSMHCNGPAPYARVQGRKVQNRRCRLNIAMSANLLEMEIL